MFLFPGFALLYPSRAANPGLKKREIQIKGKSRGMIEITVWLAPPRRLSGPGGGSEELRMRPFFVSLVILGLAAHAHAASDSLPGEPQLAKPQFGGPQAK